MTAPCIFWNTPYKVEDFHKLYKIIKDFPSDVIVLGGIFGVLEDDPIIALITGICEETSKRLVFLNRYGNNKKICEMLQNMVTTINIPTP